MNVLFHTTAAIGIIAVVVKPRKSNDNLFSNSTIKQGIGVFLIGVLSHGVLDVIPHCYPINSKVDAIFSLLLMCLIIFFINNKHKVIVGMAFLGSIFPDLIDLAPQIINVNFGTSLPQYDKIFPWHWHHFSGSIYSKECNLSMVYHTVLMVFVGIIVLKNKKKLIDCFKN